MIRLVLSVWVTRILVSSPAGLTTLRVEIVGIPNCSNDIIDRASAVIGTSANGVPKFSPLGIPAGLNVRVPGAYVATPNASWVPIPVGATESAPGVNVGTPRDSREPMPAGVQVKDLTAVGTPKDSAVEIPVGEEVSTEFLVGVPNASTLGIPVIAY
jgi:hypothetical protein